MDKRVSERNFLDEISTYEISMGEIYAPQKFDADKNYLTQLKSSNTGASRNSVPGRVSIENVNVIFVNAVSFEF